MDSKMIKLITIVLVGTLIIGMLSLLNSNALDITVNINNGKGNVNTSNGSGFSFDWKKWIPWKININNDEGYKSIEIEGSTDELVDRLEVKSLASNVEIIPIEDEDQKGISYEFKGKIAEDLKDPEIKMTLEDKKLKLEEVYQDENISTRNLRFKVYVPKNQLEEIKVSVNTGSIEVGNVKAGQVDVSTTSGNVTLAGEFKKVKGTVKTGSVKGDLLALEESFDIGIQTGSVNLFLDKDIKFGYELKTKVGSVSTNLLGTVELKKQAHQKGFVGEKNVEKGQVYIIVGTGSIHISQ